MSEKVIGFYEKDCSQLCICHYKVQICKKLPVVSIKALKEWCKENKLAFNRNGIWCIIDTNLFAWAEKEAGVKQEAKER